MNSATSLFPTEGKNELRDRARKMGQLQSRISDTPGAISGLKGTSGQVLYFIRKAKARTLDMNDHDGLVRTVDTEQMLTDRDRRYMQRGKWWKPIPEGWPGRGSYCTTLHPKEIAYLQKVVDEIETEIFQLEHDLPELKVELAKLAQHGPIPADLARRYGVKESNDGPLCSRVTIEKNRVPVQGPPERCL